MTTDAEELTRLRRAFTTPQPNDSPRPDCPPAEQIWQGARGELSPPALRETLQHIALCPICTDAWRLAEKLEEGSENVAEGSRVPFEQTSESRHAFPGGPGWVRSVGLAAAVVLAVGLGFMALEWEEAQPTVRTTAGDDEIRWLTPGPLPRASCALEWQGPAAAVSYKLRISLVTDPMNLLVREEKLAAPRFVIPEAVLADLPGEVELEIHVEAHHPLDGELHALTTRVWVR